MSESPGISFNNKYKRIATEEAFASTDLLDMYLKLYESGKLDDPGFDSLWGFYLTSMEPRPVAIREKLANLDDIRIADMDATGIDHQIISLTSPGVQVFDRDTAVSLAADSNDQLAEAIQRHPDRYSGLCAIAPQAPEVAAQELERCVKLGFKGIINNSHTHGEYLSDPKFWPIFEGLHPYDQ